MLKRIAYLFYKSGDNLVENDGVELAGYLTFLALLSLFPFLVLIVATAGFIGQGELGKEFITILLTHLPQEAVAALRPRIEEIISGPPQGLLTISILGTLWTSSSSVEGMRTVLNRAYRVSNPPTYLLRRMVSLLQIILITFVIIVVMTVFVVTPVLLATLGDVIGFKLAVITGSLTKDFIYIGGPLIFGAVASIYYVLPNIKQSLIRVVPGALLVVVLWLFAAEILTLYLDNINQVNLVYGSLSSFIAAMLFFYVMNLIFIYGAEFNHELCLLITGHEAEEKEAGEPANEAVIRKE